MIASISPSHHVLLMNALLYVKVEARVFSTLFQGYQSKADLVGTEVVEMERVNGSSTQTV
ncbi:unnamed protein product [Tenebrio molitor]|jgi:hypothetical protein|nr:unnamed protein product [Tenebrio molitor]